MHLWSGFHNIGVYNSVTPRVTGTVRWRESVEAMWTAGVTEYVEFGAKVLGPMVKRIAPDANTVSLVSMADIEAFAATL